MKTRINPKKLLHSKWTAVKPARKEKHFLVTEVEYSDSGVVTHCALEAVMSKRVITVDWRELSDEELWIQGWK